MPKKILKFIQIFFSVDVNQFSQPFLTDLQIFSDPCKNILT